MTTFAKDTNVQNHKDLKTKKTFLDCINYQFASAKNEGRIF